MRYIKGKSATKTLIQFRVKNKKMIGCVGQCYPGWGCLIEVEPRQCPKDYLDTIIHESLHIIFPKKKESSILRAGTSIVNLLWRLGYRRVNNKKK